MKKMTIDGNTAAALSAYATNEVAIIYPITPSSPMAEACDEWSAKGKENIFGQKMKIVEMQSEGGAAGALHGSLLAGSLTTTFTASQGLLLMIPNMYKIAGELLPCVFNVSARALATHALSIFGDHSDVMACRQTGFAMLCSNNVQEAHDFATIAMMSTLNSKVPFLHFFDGFRTSHEIAKIDVLENKEINRLIPHKAILEFRKRALDPKNPHQQGTAQNPDVFFQNREAANKYYNECGNIVLKAMQDYEKISGRKYSLYQYYGDKNATKVIVAMGSACDTIEETIDHLNKKGEKLGLLKVRLYRPFYASEFVKALPKTTQFISVLDRTKESGSLGEPLYLDVVAALNENKKNNTKVLGGRYGLGSKEFTPAMAKAVFDNCKANGKNHFTVGINDDLTYTSLHIPNFEIEYDGTQCLFYGLGSDGTVSANKNSIKIIGENTKLYAQGYFVYDSKKSGSVTISHLRFGKTPIKAPFVVDSADFIACHNARYVGKYDFLSKLKKGGTLLLNCDWKPEELEEKLPCEFKQKIAKNNIEFYIIDAQKIADEIGLRGKINTIMQSAFFYLTKIIPYENAKVQMKKMAQKSYAKAGEEVVQKNFKAIDLGKEGVIKVNIPSSWKNAKNKLVTQYNITTNDFAEKIIKPVEEQKGDSLPCSAFTPDGVVPTDTTKFEKRGIAPSIPCWLSENCIQCNMCSMVCPHGAIKAVLVDENTKTSEKFECKTALGTTNKKFRIQVSPLDCTGCGSCAKICPAKNKALVMSDAEKQIEEQRENWIEASKLQNDTTVFPSTTIKGSQFKDCHFQFSGACAGCGETPYIKLVTQLFGKNMIIANATGCSSIYGGSYPVCPYTKDKNGYGPAWANSLFEDNAEFGFGMEISTKNKTDTVINLINKAISQNSACKNEMNEWLNSVDNFEQNEIASNNLLNKINEEIKTATGELKQTLKSLIELKDFFKQKCVWAIGGDGWAYDIGYGGLDHILASNENINILVLDSQVYSNTGGQSSKATPLGAVAKFAENGKSTSKKSLALMALNYPNCYVAQIALGANMNQAIQAINEAVAHKGPSLIVAYSTCVNHGIDMGNSMEIMKKAVQSGYWHLFRYIPEQQKLKLDSPAPTLDFIEFVKSERRFANLYKVNPEYAQSILEQSKKDSEILYNKLKKLAESE